MLKLVVLNTSREVSDMSCFLLARMVISPVANADLVSIKSYAVLFTSCSLEACRWKYYAIPLPLRPGSRTSLPSWNR